VEEKAESRPTDAAAPPAENLVCWKVWGGNGKAEVALSIPGLRGHLYSQPCDSERGGDLYYLSACGSGALARLCVADVTGHGESVATFSGWLEEVFSKTYPPRQSDRRSARGEPARHRSGLGIDVHGGVPELQLAQRAAKLLQRGASADPVVPPGRDDLAARHRQRCGRTSPVQPPARGGCGGPLHPRHTAAESGRSTVGPHRRPDRSPGQCGPAIGRIPLGCGPASRQ